MRIKGKEKMSPDRKKEMMKENENGSCVKRLSDCIMPDSKKCTYKNFY